MNQPYHGPLGVFTVEEMAYVRAEIRLSSPKTPEEEAVKASILEKIRVVESSDPKWREPASRQEEMKARQGLT
jgi:hypothetical protein